MKTEVICRAEPVIARKVERLVVNKTAEIGVRFKDEIEAGAVDAIQLVQELVDYRGHLYVVCKLVLYQLYIFHGPPMPIRLDVINRIIVEYK